MSSLRRVLGGALIALLSTFMLALAGCGGVSNKVKMQNNGGGVTSTKMNAHSAIADAYNIDNAKTSYLVESRTKIKTRLKYDIGMAVSVDYDASSMRCFLITNAHVVSASHTVYVRGWAGREAQKAVVEWHDNQLDLAIVSFEAEKNCDFANLAGYMPKLGVKVYAFGQALREKGLVTYGRVSGYWDLHDRILMVSDLFSSKGFSGGGLFDGNDRLVGIVQGKTKTANGFSFIIPSYPIKNVVEEQLRIIKAKYDNIQKACGGASLTRLGN